MRKVAFLLCLVMVGLFFIVGHKKKAECDAFNALVDETNECLQAGDWKCVERGVRELLKVTPNDTNLRMHLAGSLFEQERYDECVQYIESLDFKHETLDYLSEKSKLLEREMETLGVEKSMHFRLEFDGSPSKKDVMEVLAVLEVAYDSISNLFDFLPENKIGIVLYEAKDFQGVGPHPEWVAAVFDGKLRVPVNLMEFREVYRPVLFHELTHAFVRAMTHSSIPLWMNEGIAQVIDASRTNFDRPYGSRPSLKSLTEAFVKESDSKMALKLYWYSQRMVEELLKRGGDDAFVKFAKCVKELGKIGTDEALLKYFGITPQKLLESI